VSERVHAPTSESKTSSLAPKAGGRLQRQSLWSGPGLTDEHAKRLVSQPPLWQPKLTINAPGDKYEQEADRVADTVMRMPEPSIQRAPT
jgi:hypothetical protein